MEITGLEFSPNVLYNQEKNYFSIIGKYNFNLSFASPKKLRFFCLCLLREHQNLKFPLTPNTTLKGNGSIWNTLREMKKFTFYSWMLQKLPSISKNVSNKNCWALNFVQKICGRICLSPSGVELGGSKDSHVWHIIMYINGKVDSLYGSTLSKIRVISKNASRKSCWALNFVQKSQWALSPAVVELGSSKDSRVWRITIYINGKVYLL